MKRLFVNYKIMLTLFLIPSIALSSDETNKDNDHGKNFELAATQETCNTSDENAEKISETTIKISQFSSDTVGKIAQTVIMIGSIALIIYSGIEIIKLCKDAYVYFNLSKEKKAIAAEVAQQYELFKVKRKFRECLMENAKKQHNEAGFPVDCEECGRVFAQTAEEEAFNDMLELFKRYF